MDRDGRAVYMQLSNYTAAALISPHQLQPECALVRTLPEPQETDQDILRGVFVGQERLPAAVGGVVSSQQLDGLGSHFVVYLVYLRVVRRCS